MGIMEKLADNMRPLPLWDLPLEFETRLGTTKTVYMSRGPLGVQFSKSAPITISSVKDSSHAQILGIEKGWLVTKIGDADVRHETNRNRLAELLRQGSRILPHDGGSPIGSLNGV